MIMLELKIKLLEHEKIACILRKLYSISEKLPDDVKSELREILNCKQVEYDSDWFNLNFEDKVFKAYSNGELIDLGICSMNPHLKLIKYHVMDGEKISVKDGGGFIIGELEVENFEAYADDQLIMRW